MNESTYSLFEVVCIPKKNDEPSYIKNLLFPSSGWRVELDLYLHDNNLEQGRTVLLADHIEVSPYHNFHR